MQCFNDIASLNSAAPGCVLAIGNFDGVHRGHQALLALARGIADADGLALGVLTFEPHPRRLFRPDDPPFRLTPATVKARRLAECGVDRLYSLPFDWDFASQTAEQFIETVLKATGSAHIVVGPDFRFGQLRAGTIETLRAHGFTVTVPEKETDETGEILSSSRIRQALAEGHVGHANQMLGWDWEIAGPVVHGDKRGRELGYPTANVHLGETLHPAYGVYAVRVQIEGEHIWHHAATNIGIRPMFEVPVGQVETYIFDFNGDIYGKTLRIRPVKRLRGEARFESLEALTAQIARDCDEARAVLS